MSRTHDDDAPVEHDPTGMRALLSSLPEPGPMPDDLVARISAALAAEAGAHVVPGVPEAPARVSGEGSHAAAGDRGTVVPMRRRSWGRHLGVAAAVAGVVGLGGVALELAQGGLTASFDAQSAAGGDSGTSYSEEKGAAGGGAPALAEAPQAGSGQVVVVRSDRAYSSAELGSQARTAGGDQVRDLASEAPSIGPIGTSVGARACADALGISPTAGILVDLAVVDDQPAAVLVVTDETGTRVWAVGRSCTTGNTALIRGPVPLG